jgi:putative membrane protein
MSIQRFPIIFLSLYLLLFLVMAVEPYDRSVWFVENLPVVILVVALVLTYKIFNFSKTAYFLMWIYFCFHTLGAHFTFELVPFDFGNKILLAFESDFLFVEDRNNFDRLGHFLVGLFAYPIVELLVKKEFVKNSFLAFLMAVFAIGFWAALYEIIEMFYAVLEGGSSGAAFLGSQGDIWDAQKDMLLNILGAIVFASFAVYNFKHYSK